MLQDAIEAGNVTATINDDGRYTYDIDGPVCAGPTFPTLPSY